MTVHAVPAARTGADALRASTAAAGAPPARPVQGASPAQGASPEQEAPAHKPTATRADPPPDPQAAFATGQYLVQLLAAQTGGAPEQLSRPAHITPERLSALVEFLENHVPHRTAAARRQSVDTSA